ncbi:unnamed protein product [Pedinophyceae sp. YPF-701]|nr:unnamed protein product [Pedinophyceae sp. YPF-701]
MRARAAAGDAGEPDGPTNDAEIHSEVCTVTIRAQAGREAGGNGGGGKREGGRFKHGNYHNYYGKRLEKRSPLDDPRLAVFDPAWFKGRTMLDVGCHEGVVILSVAQRFGISGALGIDIDPVLVRRAVRRLMAARNAAREERRGHAPTHGAEATLLPPAERLDALKHVRFRAGDVLSLEGEVPRGTFGVVTCLSVTKWVHIHGGDDGLRRLLRLLAGAAEPGGHVIVEPQPWKSYRQAASHRDTKQEWMPGRLAELQLRPEDIPRLLSEEGLVEVGVLRPEGSKEGFGRPLHVLRKPGAPGAGDA